MNRESCRRWWAEGSARWGRLRVAACPFFVRITLAAIVSGACGARAADLLPPMTNGVASEFAARRSGAEVGAALRIEIGRTGLFRITHSNLVAAGVSNPVGSQLRLFCRTQEVALATSTEGAWGAADHAIFYGRQHDGYHSTNNVYWLGFGDGGLRMGERSGAPVGGAPDVTTHWATVRYDPDTSFNPLYRPSDGTFDHWFAIAVLTPAGNAPFVVQTTNRVPAGSSTWRFGLWGRSSDAGNNTDHVTRVIVNGLTNAFLVFDGLDGFVGTATVSAATLSNGANAVALRQGSGAVQDFASLEWADVVYLASNRPAQETLAFAGVAGTNTYAAGPWSASNGIWVLDVTDAHHPVKLTNVAVQAIGGGFGARWGDVTTGSNTYFIASTAAFIQVSNPVPTRFRGLATTNRQADYIMICDYSMRPQAYRLAKHRVKNGQRVVVAPITDVYNEFSYGIKDAAAIKQFLGYAFHHWAAPSPLYALLVGDGSSDPRNVSGVAAGQDVIPVHLGPSAFDFSAQDNWFATVNGSDYLTDIAIGRIPVASDLLLSNVVTKIVAYEALSNTNAWRRKALVVADTDDIADLFRNASESNVVANLAATTVTNVTPAYLGYTALSPAAMRTIITNKINEGMFAVSYFGHGFTEVWSGAAFFTTNDIARLTNNVWPIFNILTCRNGDFENHRTNSLAEKLIERNGRGAVAVTAAAALSVQEAAEHFADGYYQAFSNSLPWRLAVPMQRGFLELYGASPLSAELLFYNLFGDPAMAVNP